MPVASGQMQLLTDAGGSAADRSSGTGHVSLSASWTEVSWQIMSFIDDHVYPRTVVMGSGL